MVCHVMKKRMLINFDIEEVWLDDAKDITTVKTQIAKAKSTFGNLKPVFNKFKNI